MDKNVLTPSLTDTWTANTKLYIYKSVLTPSLADTWTANTKLIICKSLASINLLLFIFNLNHFN